jgi:hypothetical protein
MRFTLALLLPLSALAQPAAIPPPLRQAASLINDFGNTKRYAANPLIEKAIAQALGK